MACMEAGEDHEERHVEQKHITLGRLEGIMTFRIPSIKVLILSSLKKKKIKKSSSLV